MSIPGPEVGYTDLIDFCLDNQTNDFNAFPLRPSSAGKCTRALAFETIEYLGKGGPYKKPPMEANVKRLLSLGHVVEKHVIDGFYNIAKANPEFSVRYKQQSLPLFRLQPVGTEKPPLIEGSLDLGMMRKNKGGAFIDVKSAKDKMSKFFKTSWDEMLETLHEMDTVEAISETAFYVSDLAPFLEELNDPFFEDNFLQLNLYCCSEFAKEHDVDHGVILKYNKNDSRQYEVRFTPSDAVLERVKTKFQAAYILAMMGGEKAVKSISCDFPPGHIKHAFCACHHYAEEDVAEALQSYFDTFPPKQWATETRKLNDDELLANLEAFDKLQDTEEEMKKLEHKINDSLLKAKINKVKLLNGHIYELKNYKTGGIKNGPRVALKRGKV